MLEIEYILIQDLLREIQEEQEPLEDFQNTYLFQMQKSMKNYMQSLRKSVIKQQA